MSENMEERILELERWKIVQDATRGTLRLCTGHVALLWAVMLAVLSFGAGVLHLEFTTSENSRAIIVLTAGLRAHESLPSHPVMLEKVLAMQATLNEVRTLVEYRMGHGLRP